MTLRTKASGRLACVGLIAVLLGTDTTASATGFEKRPATPCPCAADGACRPNGPWGHTPTRWRPWPGDIIGRPPTPADEVETREQLQLDPFELPEPEREGQRGPNITRPSRDRSDDEPEGDLAPEQGEVGNFDQELAPPQEVDLPLQPLPEAGLDVPNNLEFGAPADVAPEPELAPPEEAEPVDDFDPFGAIDRLPRSLLSSQSRLTKAPSGRIDAPPALPASLRKLSRRSQSMRRELTSSGRTGQSSSSETTLIQ